MNCRLLHPNAICVNYRQLQRINRVWKKQLRCTLAINFEMHYILGTVFKIYEIIVSKTWQRQLATWIYTNTERQIYTWIIHVMLERKPSRSQKSEIQFDSCVFVTCVNYEKKIWVLVNFDTISFTSRSIPLAICVVRIFRNDRSSL